MTVPAARRRVYVALTLLLVLLAIEAGVRALVAIRLGPRALAYGLVDDATARHTVALHDDLRAGYSKYRGAVELRDFDPLTGTTFPVHVNSRGFRGAEFPAAPEPGAVRVVTLGASSTFGYHARDDETWPRQLEERLARRCPGRRYEVLNLGIPHLLSEEIAALFAAEALPLRPDVVTFYEGVNDASMRRERHHLRKAARRSATLRAGYRALRDHLMLVRLADEVVRPRAQRFDAAAVAEHVAGRPERFLASLDAIREECARRGILFLVATQQATSLEFPREALRGLTVAEEEARLRRRLDAGDTVPAPALAFLTHAEMMRELRTWAAARDVPLVDVAAALDDRRDVLVSWVHLTPDGNGRIADAFAPAILERTCR